MLIFGGAHDRYVGDNVELLVFDQPGNITPDLMNDDVLRSLHSVTESAFGAERSLEGLRQHVMGVDTLVYKKPTLLPRCGLGLVCILTSVLAESYATGTAMYSKLFVTSIRSGLRCRMTMPAWGARTVTPLP